MLERVLLAGVGESISRRRAAARRPRGGRRLSRPGRRETPDARGRRAALHRADAAVRQGKPDARGGHPRHQPQGAVGKAEALRYALTVRDWRDDVSSTRLAATLAPRCAACAGALDAPLEGPVCPWCWQEATAAAGRYDGALRQIIHAFKYEGRRSLARPLGATAESRRCGIGCATRTARCPSPSIRGGGCAADSTRRPISPRSSTCPVVHALWRTRADRAADGSHCRPPAGATSRARSGCLRCFRAHTRRADFRSGRRAG